MGMTSIAGAVSGLRAKAEVIGNRDQVGTRHSVHMRIGNRAALMKTSPNLVDGDVVTAVGRDSAEFEIVALRNESTGVIYSEGNGILAIIVGALMILLAISTIFFIVPPLFLLPIGGFTIWKGIRVKIAEKMLRETPAPVPASG